MGRHPNNAHVGHCYHELKNLFQYNIIEIFSAYDYHALWKWS